MTVLAEAVEAAGTHAAVGRLAPGIAHEINTPTQYIGDNLRFLLSAFHQLVAQLPAGAGDSELAFLLEEIPVAIAQSLDGVTQVGQIAGAVRRFASPPGEETAMMDLNQEVETVLTIARHEWKYVAQVTRDLDPGLPLVPCAVMELRRLLLALVVDAAAAIASTPSVVARAGELPAASTGGIAIATRCDGDWAELQVGDSAAPDAERARQALACAAIVAGQGGTLHMEDDGARGTRVVVRLPLRGPTPAAAAAPADHARRKVRA